MESVNLPLTWASLWTVLSLLGTILFGSGAILNWIYRELNAIRRDASEIKVAMAKEYVTLSSLHEFEQRIERSLGRIESRLDGMVGEQVQEEPR
jgi:hypothetical protein